MSKRFAIDRLVTRSHLNNYKQITSSPTWVVITPPHFSSRASPIADDDYDYYIYININSWLQLPVSFKQASQQQAKGEFATLKKPAWLRELKSQWAEIYEQKRWYKCNKVDTNIEMGSKAALRRFCRSDGPLETQKPIRQLFLHIHLLRPSELGY